MKRRLLFVAILAGLLHGGIAVASDGPPGKGSWLLDGRIGFSSTWGDEQSQERGPGNEGEISISPSLMYFTSSSLAFGGKLQIESVKLAGTRYFRLGVGPQLGLYARLGQERRYFYSETGASLTAIGVEDGDSKVGTQLSFGLGFLEFVAKQVAVKFGVEITFQRLAGFAQRSFAPGPGFPEVPVGDSDFHTGQITSLVVGLGYFTKGKD